MIHTILHYFETGNGYQFWSGIGGCASYVIGPAAMLAAWYHHHNCAAHKCPLPGRYIHPEHGNRVCKKHLMLEHQIHPDGKTYAFPEE